MNQCSKCGTLNKDAATKCGVCGAEIIHGQSYSRPAPPTMGKDDFDSGTVRRTSLRGALALAAVFLLGVAGVVSILTPGTAGLVLGSILIVLGFSMGLTVVKYLKNTSRTADQRDDNQGSETVFERPVYHGSSSLGEVVYQIDKLENSRKEKENE